MTKDDAYILHSLLEQTKSKDLDLKVLKKYIRLKLDLLKVKKDVDETREKMLEETKVENEDVWNERFKEVFSKFLLESAEIDEKRLLNIDEVIKVIKVSEFNGKQEDFILEHMLSDTEKTKE